MCSTFSTSSASTPALSPATGASAMDRAPSDPLDEDVDRHRDQDRDPEVEVEVVGIDALDDQAVVEDAEKHGADQRPDDGPRPAGQQGSADHRRGDPLEQ